MKKQRKEIELAHLQANTGQLDWLPRNPRTWTKADIERTAKSIKEDTDFLDDRPLLVVPTNTGFVVFCGNLRREGAIQAKLATVPCVVYYPATDEDRETVLRRAMKDNGSFGSWDYDALANEWDDLPLTDWGVPAWEDKEEENPDAYGTDFSLPEGERIGFQQMQFTLSDEQVAEVKEALKDAKALVEYATMITYGNENGNGNALALIIEQWIASRK